MAQMTKITFVGDIMCDEMMSRGLERYYDERKGIYDFSPVFSPMREYFSQADLVFANLETPLSKDDKKLTRKRYEFCSSIEFARALHDAGIDHVAAANNHCMDRGYDGIIETIQCLDEIGLGYAGIHDVMQPFRPRIIDINGLRLGFLSYTYGTNAFSNKNYLSFKERRAVDLLQEQEEDKLLFRSAYRNVCEDPDRFIAKIYWKVRSWSIKKPIYERRNIDIYRRYLLKKDICELKRKGVDNIVFYLHIGGQYNKKPTDFTKKTIDRLMRMGCDVIIGNHEHVIHGYRKDKSGKRLATYALGNFLGSSGNIEPPYDRYCDFSIAINAYIDNGTKSIKKYTFSLMKTCYDKKKQMFSVSPAFDLYHKLDVDEREIFKKRALEAASLFTGTKVTELQMEYMI